MEDFCVAINKCGFKDLGYNGPDFTWCNMREGKEMIYLRLDRALAILEWIDQYGNMRVHHLVDSVSDHCTLLVIDSIPQRPSKRRRFHFEAMWTKREECKSINSEV